MVLAYDNKAIKHLLRNIKTQNKFIIFVFLPVLFTLINAFITPTQSAHAWTVAECMSSANSVIGTNIVNANYETFYERCDSSAPGSGTYGMIYINSTTIPEISSNNDTFQKDLKRTTISTVTNSSANAYVCTSASGVSMSSNMTATTSSTAGQFSSPSGSGTLTVDLSKGTWTQDGAKYKRRFNYNSCLGASACNSQCHEFPMIIYVYRVAYPSATDAVSSVTNATQQSNGKYKTTSSDGSYTINFAHTLSSNKAWSGSSVTSGQWSYCTAQGDSSADCTPSTSNPTLTPTYSGTLNHGDEVTVCSWVKFPRKVGLDTYAPTISYTWSSGACATVYREDPPIYTAAITGALSIGAPSNTTHISGTSYLGYYGIDDYSATATKSLTRTDSETNISSITAKGTAQTGSSQSGTFSNRTGAGASISANLTRTAPNNTTSNTHTVSINDVAVGGSKTVCDRLAYYASPTMQLNVQTDGSLSYTTPSCVTVYRPARATFSGTVAYPSANNDTNIKSQSNGNLLGNGSATSYSIKTTYTITRTNDNPTSATSKYTTSTSSQPDSASTLSGSLQKNETYNPTANNTKSITQNVGTKGDYCFYMTYEKEIDYYGGTNRINDRYSIDKVYNCTTFYNPKYADVTSAMDVSVVGMTGNATSGFRGNGYDETYTPVVHYILKRVNNDANSTPTNATSRFAVNTAASTSYDATKFPASVPGSGTGKGGTATDLSRNRSPIYDYPVAFSLSFAGVAEGTTITKCSYLKYDSRIGYIGDTVLTTPFDTRSQSTNYICANFLNPYKYTATFSASISVANGSYLSGTSNTNSTSNSREGNGLYGQYTITPTYIVKRSNNSPAIGVTSRYAISDVSQPTADATKTFTPALKYNETETINKPAKTVQVDIGGTATQCFYITFDNQVKLIGSNASGDSSGNVVIGKPDGVTEDRSFEGKQYVCYVFTNPAQTYTAHYTGTSAGTIDSHTWLDRSDNNHMGVLDNAIRISGTNTNSDGSYTDHFPKKPNGTADDVYTVSFTHVVNRTDTDKSSTASTVYYVNPTVYNWEIQDCEDAGCVAGVYRSYTPTTRDTDASRTVSGVKSTLSVSSSNTINTQAKFTFNATNKGKYLYYCQRVAYSTTAVYTSATDPSNRNWHLDSLDEDSIRQVSYSTPACVTIRNPDWHEANSTTRTHYIDVSGIPGNTIYPSGARLLSGTQYETITIELSFLFDHSITRYDNNTWRTNNFDETDVRAADTAYYTNNPSTGRAFFQPTIYGDSNYSVHTPSTDLRMYGSETLPGTRDTVKLINPLKLQSGSLVEIDGRDLVLNARDKDHGDSWSSTANDGRTRIGFNGLDREKLRMTNAREKDLSYHSLMAGDTKNFTMSTYNSRAAWSVRYREITRQEVYPGSWKSNASGSQIYNRTEKVDSEPQLTTPVKRDSRDTTSPTVYSIFRPYNFIINNIVNSNVDSIALAENSYTINYTIDIGKENNDHEYITDPNHTDNARYVYVVGYVVDKNATIGQLQTLTPAHAPTNGNFTYSGNAYNDVCGVINRNSFVKDCHILTDGHPNKLSKKDGESVDPGTSFKHVYNLSDYQLSYTTGVITVPDLPVGDKYCVAIAVRNYSSASSSYFVSTSSCRNVSKRPNFQVWGGSVLSNGDITTTITDRGGKVFGSWADYAIIANDTIKRIGSGATLISGATVTASTCTTVPNPLTISNAYCNHATNKYLGRASIDARLENIERFKDYLPTNAELNSIPVVCGSGGCRREVDAGKTYVVRTDDDITISENIYNNYSSSQVVIIAKNIYIDQSVTNLDAILIASGPSNNGGTVDTCKNYTYDALNNNVCTNKLTVNGLIIASKVYLKRTSGGDPVESIKEPAELVNFQPSIFIWAQNRSANAHNPQMVYIKKLPPRY